MNLCNFCQEAHLRQRETTKHNVIVLLDLKNKHADIKKDKSNRLNSNAPFKCFIHPVQDIKWYCVICNQVACYNCTIVLHKGHTFQTIDRIKQNAIKELKLSVEKNQKLHQNINDVISKLNGCIKNINSNADAVQVSYQLDL